MTQLAPVHRRLVSAMLLDAPDPRSMEPCGSRLFRAPCRSVVGLKSSLNHVSITAIHRKEDEHGIQEAETSQRQDGSKGRLLTNSDIGSRPMSTDDQKRHRQTATADTRYSSVRDSTEQNISRAESTKPAPQKSAVVDLGRLRARGMARWKSWGKERPLDG